MNLKVDAASNSDQGKGLWHMLPIVSAKGRRRIIFNTWPRDPNGPVLAEPLPKGKHTPNGLMWGATLDSFFVTNRLPCSFSSIITVWTRSMIKEFGENFYKLEEIDESEPDPVVIEPYHCLMLMRVESASSGVVVPHGLLFPSVDASGVKMQPRPPMEELPKLEEFIHEEHFPDILLVHDPDDLTPGYNRNTEECDEFDIEGPRRSGSVVKYKRVWPVFDRNRDSGDLSGASGSSKTPAGTDSSAASALKANPLAPGDAQELTAHLYISTEDFMGKGHHSLVYNAALSLPLPLVGNSPTGQVTVAAKIAKPRTEARDMLKNEAAMYNKFPKHLMEEWSGLNLVKPYKFPVPADAVVPKFYGYYEPVNPDIEDSKHGLSPILLLEQCGEPIDISTLDIDERSQCYTHILRLHLAGFMQNSVYVRNMLVQPGPLCVPPADRTMASATFRIIDFGRGQHFDSWVVEEYGKLLKELSEKERSAAIQSWSDERQHQERKAKDALGLDPFECFT